MSCCSPLGVLSPHSRSDPLPQWLRAEANVSVEAPRELGGGGVGCVSAGFRLLEKVWSHCPNSSASNDIFWHSFALFLAFATCSY